MSARKDESIQVQCNWDSNIPNKSIEDTIIFVNYEDDGDDQVENLKDTVNVKTTVSFMMPERLNEKPVVTFNIPAQESFCIDSISLLCDSRTIEVFGEHQMYLDTFHGTTIEETDEFFVYEYKIDLSEKKNKSISLKFVKPARPSILWIYGITLRLKRTNQNSSSSSINFDKVQDLLKNSHISEQANQAFSYLREANASSNASSRFAVNGDGPSNPPENMKQYIDYKFQILTDYLIMREKGLHDKIDRVIELMKAKN